MSTGITSSSEEVSTSAAWAPGHIHGHFKVLRSFFLAELRLQLLELEHQPSGARILHLLNDDAENVFCLGFQTRPTSSNGVAHILEHTVLCGSKKYPVSDPFFSMIRRSLNTYMNALTGSDSTFYPAASQVPSDFYNLFDIYIDAVFFPNLHYHSFLQEGHRLEYSVPTDPSTPLEYKGIVYNEMKGSMAAPMSRLFESINAHLYPDLTYGVNSGGNPPEILNLTHEELCQFHKTYYHPSRCLFYFYGNIPTEQHLDLLSKRLLDHTEPAAPLSPIPSQPRFTTPQVTTCSYPAEPGDTVEANTTVALAWLTCSIGDQETLLALTVLCTILMNTDASPLKRALLDSKLCQQAFLSIDSDNAEIPIYLICKGCHVAKAPELNALILNSLAEISVRGIDPLAIDRAIHQLELHRSEITGNSVPYGLSLFWRAGLPLLHGIPPENALLIHTLFDKLRQRLADEPRYLENLLTEYLLANDHRVTTVMTPDTNLTVSEKAAEEASLAARAVELTDDKRQQLLAQAQAFALYQEKQSEEDSDVLPIVKLSEIPTASRDYPLDIYVDRTLQVFHHACFTNQITYLDYTFPLAAVEEGELPYLHLLASLFGQMGCGGRSFGANLDYIQAYTGGAGASASYHNYSRKLGQLSPQFSLSGKALHRNLDKLCLLIKDMAAGIDLTDRPRLKEIILKQWSGLQSTLTQSAMRYATNLAASGMNLGGRISYAWNGLEYYYTIKQLAESIDSSLDPLVEKLQGLQERLLHGNNAQLVITCDSEAFETLQNADYYGLASLPPRPYAPWIDNYIIPTVPNQGRLISAPVASLCKFLHAVPYIHPDGAALRIAAFLMNNVVLHHKIREQGGAYGGGAACNLMSGNFSFYSYLDPNVSSTLTAFAEATQQIATAGFTDEELFEAKLEIFQGLDAPVAPGSRAAVAYSWLYEGKPLPLRQAFRDRIFALTKSDVADAVSRHLLPQLDQGITVVFANQELLSRENSLLAKPLTLLPI